MSLARSHRTFAALILAFAAIGTPLPSANAQACPEDQFFWTGGTADWSDSTHWEHEVWNDILGECESQPGVPSAVDDARIMSGGGSSVTGDAEARNVAVEGSTLHLAGGSLNVEYVSADWHGFIAHTAGTLATGGLDLGLAAESWGWYLLRDGQLETSDNEHVGFLGHGVFEQSAGSHTSPGHLMLGRFGGGQGEYTLSAGELLSSSLTVGFEGTGTFTQTGGTATVSSRLALGHDPTGHGQYDLSGNGSLQVDTLDIGPQGTGLFNQAGGTLLVDALIVGVGGEGTLAITGADAKTTITGALTFGSGGTFQSTVQIPQLFLSGADFHLEGVVDGNGLQNATLVFVNQGEWNGLEVAGEDVGSSPYGWTWGAVLGAVFIGTETENAHIHLVDASDNGNRIGPGGEAEALYVGTLALGPGSVLDLDGLRVYCIHFVDYGGTVLNGTVYVPVPGDVDGDGDVDTDDYILFDLCMGGPTAVPGVVACQLADLDLDGSVDLADFAEFQVLLAAP